MTCEDITYRISTGRLMVKPVGWENAKKVYAVFGCKSDTNKGSILMGQKTTDEYTNDSDMMMGGDESNNDDDKDDDSDSEDGDKDETSSGSGSNGDNDGNSDDDSDGDNDVSARNSLFIIY